MRRASIARIVRLISDNWNHRLPTRTWKDTFADIAPVITAMTFAAVDSGTATKITSTSEQLAQRLDFVEFVHEDQLR